MTQLFVASTGGHLSQLWRLAPRIVTDLTDDVLWVTFDSPQSRSLLEGRDVFYLDYIAPRGFRALARNLPRVRRLLRERTVSSVVSTGSGIALAVLPLARAHGAECHYIESAARSQGPSVTGRAMQIIPGIRTYTQYPAWSSDTWRYVGSVFDGFEAEAEAEVEVRRVVVSVGTIPFKFDRFLQRLATVLPATVDVLWQVGVSSPVGLPGRVVTTIPSRELEQACRDADLVVCHAGTGSALMALEAGKRPVLVAREPNHNEHVDDHQRLIARELHRRGLGVETTVEALTWEFLADAARGSVTARHSLPAVNMNPTRQRVGPLDG